MEHSTVRVHYIDARRNVHFSDENIVILYSSAFDFDFDLINNDSFMAVAANTQKLTDREVIIIIAQSKHVKIKYKNSSTNDVIFIIILLFNRWARTCRVG